MEISEAGTESAVAVAPRLAKIAKLVARSTGPDRQIDGALFELMDPEAFARKCTFRGRMYAGVVHTKAEKRAHEVRWAAIEAPQYTASQDAVMTLLGEKMKGFWRLHLTAQDGVAHASIITRESTYQANDARTPALAVLGALLAALSNTPTATGKEEG